MRYKRERLSCRRKKSVRQIKSNKLAGNRQQEIQTKRRETEMSETKANETKVIAEIDENEKDVVEVVERPGNYTHHFSEEQTELIES